MNLQTLGEGYRRRKQSWKNIQTSSLFMLLCFAFLLFSAIGLLVTSTAPYRMPPLLFWALVTSYGAFAVVYAYISLRIHWLLTFAVMPIQFFVNMWLQIQMRHQPLLSSAAHSDLLDRVNWANGLVCLLIVASYTLVFIVMGREGKRFFRMNAEMELASEIHRTLVPLIDLRVGDFEIYGLSLPSGEVGGDLVDAVLRPEEGSWIAYVADVSGHGVSSGVLMATLKSAMHMSLRQSHEAPKMLDEVNSVFYRLKSPNSFATFAAISYTMQQGLAVIVAGHLPILYFDGQKVHDLDTPGLPLGILPESNFVSRPFDFKPGEVLAIVTDGLTEIFNKKGIELEDGYIRQTLLKDSGRPLQQIAKILLEQANAWGPGIDDQSVLLVRRVA